MKRRSPWRVVLPLFLLGLVVSSVMSAVGCSRANSKESATGEPRTTRLRIVFSREGASGAWFGLTETSPAFLGVSARSLDGDYASARAVGDAGETTLDVPVGKRIVFRSTLVSSKAGEGFLYHSQATKEVTIEADTSEVVLSFVPYKPVKPINVYGLVHSDKQTPAAGAQVRILDPYTEAPIQAPGATSFAVADGRGTFSGSFPFDAFPGLSKVTLEITFGGKTSSITVPFTRGTGPGLTLPFVNLATGGTDVVPRFSRTEDFDGDGTPNVIELASGTNPFSELSGARGKDGPATLVSATTASATQCVAGGVVVQYYVDVDGSLSVNTGDTPVGTAQVLCNGLPGAQGPMGEPGATGTAGATLKVRRRDSGAELSLKFVQTGFQPEELRLATTEGWQFWYNSSNSNVMNSKNCWIYDTFSGASQWQRQCGGYSAPGPWSSYNGRCYFQGTSCASTTCLIAARPLPSSLFVLTMSGGSPSFLQAPSNVSATTGATFPSGGSYVEIYESGSSGCNMAMFSPGSTFSGSFHSLNVVGAPSGISFPLPPFYIAP